MGSIAIGVRSWAAGRGVGDKGRADKGSGFRRGTTPEDSGQQADGRNGRAGEGRKACLGSWAGVILDLKEAVAWDGANSPAELNISAGPGVQLCPFPALRCLRKNL